MNEDTWESIDTRERTDHELIRGYLIDAPVKLEGWELKAKMNNPEMMAFGESNWKYSELLRMGEKKSHNRKQLWEDVVMLESRIFERTDKIWRKTLLRSSNVENEDENHHDNLWDTPEQRRIEMLNQRWKEFERSWRKTFDWWQFILTSNFEKNLMVDPGK